MGDQRRSRIYLAQLKAMLKRNLLLKKRDKRRTMAEVLLPIYTLGVLFLIKLAGPNPHFPEISRPRGEAELMANFRNISRTVAVVPNSTEVQDFLKTIDLLWEQLNEKEARKVPPISWVIYSTLEDLLTAYWLEPNNISIAVIFQSPDPITGPLSYEIRTNPNLYGTPSTTQLFGSPASCREYDSFWQNVVPGVPTPVLPEALEVGESCPVNQYYYSGFLALQALIDFAKIKLDAGIDDFAVPKIFLEMFPKTSYTGNWMVIYRVLIPLYTVVALSQFITYLLILIVGEKESKIKEGMKIMGLYDSVFWLSWFIIYAIFVLLLTIICCSLLFALNIFTNTSFIMVFMLIFMYSLSIIMFGFMITPFFDKSRTAGILGNFAVTILSLLYFIQVFVRDSSSVALWIVSLISPAGFALAMDKALLMDLAGEGVNISNVWSGPDMPFGGSLIMMAVDVVLYGWIAYYLDNVIPSENGVKRSPFFCFSPVFWCNNKPADKMPLTNGESVGSVGSLNTGEEGFADFEPVPREMKGKEAIKIVDLYKSFKSFRKPEVKAINGINLTIYQGHITAILGHNGAGKTTLFNILTGLTAPTSGTAYIFGYDVRNQNEMDQVRRMTGVCPQHDILFDNLTPKEHLEFFATVKGIPSSRIEQEVSKTLKDIDLSDKANDFARHLSGGQKRKLSVGIAVIGDPKIIILDEPTAGVDPYSRRHMWNFLQSRRHGKIILLTTHFMDEADILADRKAVVSKGSIRCCGSSLFLKNKFGIGYHLTLVLEGQAKEQAIARLVTTHVPKAEKARRHGRELSFILPHNAVDHFASLFTAIELELNNKSSKLGISSYGVSMTTLEEVFLHLEKASDDEPDETVDNLSKKIVRNRALSRSLSLQSKSTSYQSLENEGNNLINGQDIKVGDMTDLGGLEAISETKSPITGIGLDKVECKPNACQTIIALIKLRALRMIRDLQKLYFMILLPLVCAAVSLYFNNYLQGAETTSNSLELNGTTYGDMSTVAIHNGSEDNLTNFIDQLVNLGVQQVDGYNGNFSSLLDFAPHMAAFDVSSFDAGDYNITILYNDTFQHSLPITLNLLSNSIYRLYSPEKVEGANFEPIKIMVQPFQQTMQPEGINIGSITSTIFVGMVFVMVPVSLAIDLVYDRELKTKNQLRVNGLSTTMYFITYFIVLIAIMVVICASLVIMMVAFDIPALRDWPAIVVFSVLIFIYCPSSILSCTCLSYIFDKTDSAQSILPNIATFVGWLPFLFVVLLDMMTVGKKVAMALHCIFALTNNMYIPYSIVYYIQRVYYSCNVKSACDKLTVASYLTPEIGILLVGMILNIPLWFMLLKIVDIKKSGGKASDAFQFLKKKRKEDLINEASEVDVGDNEDQDVKIERDKVRNITCSENVTPPVVVVQNLHKEYKNQNKICCACCFKPEEIEDKRKVAIKSLSLAVDAGEVFGLLGHNGAGKTTTMKIITAEEAPTRGRVFIGGQSITSNINSAFQLLGYCPQHDALWKNITVREHIEIYAAIRGVPHSDINKVVNRFINGLQINEHADKQVKQCSGGTKRKLSFAMAMVGNPKIVLLDEPSTGMDPRSKRFLWDTILASFQGFYKLLTWIQHEDQKIVLTVREFNALAKKKKFVEFQKLIKVIYKGSKGAILTTHSMEEADALCSRVGIMVKGGLRCLGSTQHLKNLYGAGYTLEMKLKGGESTPTSETGDRHNELKEFVSDLFPDASLEETFVDRLVFSVPQQSVPSLANCFMQLEKAKLELDIEEYSFSQTTLEQVFLKFAQYDEVNAE